MKPLLLLILCPLISTVTSDSRDPQESSPPNASDEVMRVDRAWAQAAVDADAQ
jgi:hypothetical protein